MMQSNLIDLRFFIDSIESSFSVKRNHCVKKFFVHLMKKLSFEGGSASPVKLFETVIVKEW